MGAARLESRAYENRRQYPLAVAGGHGSLGTKTGDYLIAYSLPKER